MNKNRPEYLHRLIDFLLRWKHVIPFAGYPLHRREGFAPFFIVGSGRSGNTLLRRILHSHSCFHIPPETYVLGRSIKVFRQNRGLAWNELTYMVLSLFEYNPEFESFEISLRPLANRIINTPRESRSLALILDGIYRYHAERKGNGCKRWGDKTPLNTFSLERIHDVFPDAQFIHIVRDGCDVVSSYLRAGIYKTMEAAAARWKASIAAAGGFVRRRRNFCFELHYESLVSDPENVVKNLCTFLGVEYEPSMVNSQEITQSMGDVVRHSHHSGVGKPISTSSIGRGRARFTLEEKQKLQKLIGHDLARWGYEPCIS